ncbi:MAG: hypothetical protein J0I41_23965, partial [Filimonas sp.]|nr:hypothetical protein [Filimonas sp.]
MHTPVSKKKGHLYLNTSLVAFGKKITYKATFLFAFVLCMSMNAGAQKTSVKQAGKNIPAWDTFSGNTYAFTKGPQLYSYSAQDANEPIAGLAVTISGTTSTCLSNGTITAQVTGSSGTVQYTLLDGTGATVKPPQNDNNVFTGLAAGTYQVSVSDDASTNVLSNKITLTTSYQALALTTTGVAPMPQYQVYSCTPSTTEGYLYVYIQSGTGSGPYKVTLYNGTGTMLSDTLVIPAGTYFGIINNLPNGNYRVGVTDACNSTVQSGTVTISNATTISYPASITNLIYGTLSYTKSSVVGCGMGFDFSTTFFNSYFTYRDTIFTFIEFPAGNYSDTSYRNGPNMHLKFPTALAPAAINGQAYILWIRDPCSKKWYSTSYKFPDGSLSLSTYTSAGASNNNCDSIIPYISVQWGNATFSSNNYCYNVRFKLFKNDAPGVFLKDTTLISGQTLNSYTFYHPTSSGDYTVTLTDANNNTETKVITITAQAPQKLTFSSGSVYADCSLSSMVYQSQAYNFLPNTTYPVTIRLLNTGTFPNAETTYQPLQILQAPASSNTWQNLFGNIPVPFTYGTDWTKPGYYDTIKYEVTWPGCSRKDTALVTFTALKYKYKSAKFTGSTVTIGSGGCSANAANVTVNWETRDTTGAVVTSYGDFFVRQLPTGAYTTSASGTYTFNNLAPGTYQFGISPNKYPISGTWNIGYSIPATCAYWDTITVVVPKLNAPSVDVSKTYGIICAGQPANSGTLTIAAVGYGPFRYAIGPKGAGTFGTNQTSNVFSNLTAGDYDIRLTDTCGSQVVQTVQVVNASDLAKIKISSVNNSLVGCSNDNVTLQLNVVGTVSNIIWTLPDNSTVKDVTSLSIPNFSAANTGTYNVSVQSAAGCPASANINMTLAQSFNLQVTSPAAICKGSTVDLTTSAITAGSSNITSWAAYTNATATTAVTSPATAAPTATTTYYIKGLSPDACVAIKPITVTVNDKASLGTLAKPAAACSGTALALTTPTVTTNGAPLNGAGKWYLNNVEFDPATLVSTADNNKTLYYSVVTDCGTTQTNSVTITVNAANSFTLQTATGTDNQSMCTGAAFTTTKFQLAGTATGVSMTGTFPTGVSGSYSGGVYTISGTPTSVGTYNYTLTSTGGTCAPATVSGTIKVSGTPSIATITLPPTVCAGNPLALVDPVITANGATVTDPHWELGTGTTRIDASTLMTYANNGQSLRYVITSTCGGPTITRTVGNITVKDKPVITITQPAAVCAGGTLSLPTPSITANGSSYTNAHWELDGVTVTSPVTVTTLNDGKMLAYVVTADCGGTVSSNLVPVKVNPIPTVDDISNSVVCNTAVTTPINFTGTVSGATYTWTNSNTAIGLAVSGTGNVPSFTAVNSGSTAVTATITVTPSANTCSGTAKTFTITVNPTPTVSGYMDLIPCAGNSIFPIGFTGSVSGTTFAWSNDNTSIGLPASGLSNIPSVIAVNNGTSPAVATITVTPSANTCDGASKTFTITVNPTPTVNDISNSVVCNNTVTSAIGFSGTVSGTTYTWTNNNTAIGLAASGTGNVPSFTATNTGSTAATATITVTPSANTCGGTSKTFTITVNPTPAVNTIANSVVCNNTTTTPISFSGTVSGTTYTWTNSNASIGLASNGSGDIPSFTAVNSGSAAVTATITVTPGANTCGGTSKTFTITVNPIPTVNTITDKVICNNTATTKISFSGNVSGATYAWTNSNAAIGLAASGTGDIPSFTATNTGSTAATATITVTPSANTCDGAAKTFTITVNPTPTINTVTNKVVCNNAATTAISFSGNVSNATYTWTNDNTTIGLAANGIGDITSFTAVNNGNTTATATITVTPSANTCDGTAKTFTITVNPTPTVNTIANKVVCNNTATTAIGFSGNVSNATYTWTNDNTAIGLAASGTGDIPSFTAANSGSTAVIATITVTPSANTCGGVSKTFTITVNPTPVVNDISNSVVCNNAATTAINFSSNVIGATYTWTNSNAAIGLAASGAGDIPSFAAANSGSTAVTATITVTPSANACGGASKTFTITVNPTPVVNDINNSVVCNNATATAIGFSSNVSGATYTWTNSNAAIGLAASGAGDIPSFTAVNSSSTPATATITVTPSANTCDGASKTFTIKVNPTPTVNAITNSVVCNNTATSAISFGSNVIDATYTWANNNPAIGLAASGAGDIPSFTAVNSGSTAAIATITVTPSANTCDGTSKSFTITVNPTPTVNTITNKVVCNNATTTAIGFSSNVSSATYTWTNSNPAIGLAASGAGDIPSFTAVNSGSTAVTATITVTPSANTCAGTSKTFTITVNPTPTVNTIADKVACNNAATSAISFGGNVSTATYTWTNNNTSIGLAASGTGDIASFTAVNTGSTATTAIITVTPSANTCAGTSKTFTITVNPTPTVNTINNQAICNGAVTTRVSFDGAVANTTYSWANSNTTIGLPASGTGDIASFTAVNTGSTVATATITVTPGANTCNGTSQSFTITVNPDAHLMLLTGNSSQVVNINTPVANVGYTVVDEKNVVVTGLPAGVTYSYTAGTVVISGTPTASGTFNYTVTATGDCAKAELTGTIIVNPDSDIKLISV